MMNSLKIIHVMKDGFNKTQLKEKLILILDIRTNLST